MSNATSRCWVITINNTHKFDSLNSVKNWSYIVAGREVGDKGTPHLQCFIIYKTRTKFSTVKIQLPTAHIERMVGNSRQASDYCKKDGDYAEIGNFEDINGYKNSGAGGVQSKINYEKIISLAEAHEFQKIREEEPGVYFRNYHTIKRIAMDNPLSVSDLDVLDNEWIWGKTGLGKSRTARLENPGYYIKSHNKWWLGYRGEACVIIDDISRSEAQWMGEHLKQWCDHYAAPVETKGDGSLIRPKKIVVTSNYSIEMLWGHDEDLCEAIKRRFKERHIIAPFPCCAPGWAPPAAQPKAPLPAIAEEISGEGEDWNIVDISTDDDEIEYHDESSEVF